MLFHALILACALAPPADAQPEPDATSTTPKGLDVVIVRVDSGADDLEQALRVRLPGAEVLPFADESFAHVQGRPFVYLEITTSSDVDATTRLYVVLSDGRAYVRDVRPDPEQPARAIAATIANTLTAIEEERLLPDRTQVEVPRPDPAPGPAAPEPAAPEPTPPVPAEPPPPPAEPPPPSLAAAPPLLFGFGATMSGLFGLAPVTPAARFPLALAVRTLVRLPVGVVIEAGVRGAGRSSAGYRLVRLRGQVAAGYAWSRRRVEVGGVIGPTLEGWTLSDPNGRVSSVGPSGGRRPVLLGAAAALSAGVLLPPAPADRVQVSLAARAELAVSALPSGSAARVIDVGPPTIVIFTAGGVEASFGVDVVVRFPVGR